MFHITVTHLPTSIAPAVLEVWHNILEAAQQQQIDLEQPLQRLEKHQPGIAQHLATVLMGSEYFCEQCLRQPQMLSTLLSSDILYRPQSSGQLRTALAKNMAFVEDFDQLCRCLRQFRRQQMCRIIFRDFNRLASLEDTTGELSSLADNCIDLSLNWLYRRLIAEWGTPVDDDGIPQQMSVVGMGKLGARELNLSSDIDLIFAYPSQGETRGGPRQVENQKFFLKLGQQLIKSLDQWTADGFVFRVDMRLRPWGQSGALVLNFDAFESYYRDHGREWERYAMIKARIVAGDTVSGERLMEMLKPFVFRKYVDYSVINALRSMKQMISREVVRRGLHNDVKLGGGGIREVEFIAQVFQLIRGGRDVDLQDRRLLRILRLLKEYEYLPAKAVDELLAAYRFLRNTEHAIQGYQDKQTQALPSDANSQQRLSAIMGFDTWAHFSDALAGHRAAVAQHFKYLIEAPEEDCGNDEIDKAWDDIWLGQDNDDEAIEWLQQNGYDGVEESWRQLSAMRSSKRVQMMQRLGRERLDTFIPRLLFAMSEQENSSELLLRILPFVESVLRRSAYMVLLLENPQAMRQLVILCSASPWIAEQLATHPVLLDELLNVENLYTVPDRDVLTNELRIQLLRLPEDDLEGQMDVLRYFRLAHVLRVAALEVTGRLPLMKVSDYLTFIAEVLLQQVQELAWQDMVCRHGRPRKTDGEPCESGFIIVGYGKLGGLEMGHASDLDLVFIFDADTVADTDGDRPISAQQFYNRLGQKIIHIMTARTMQGALYEVDMRLRPSGNSGLLSPSLKAFERYQRNDAWTWEHQALVRARPVAGDPQLAARFSRLRECILCLPREVVTLRKEVVEMRVKMSEHLLPSVSGSDNVAKFHLKHGSGGIVDIEFMVQFAVLALAHQHPSLAMWSDNVRIIETLAALQLITADEALAVTEAYKVYRTCSHKLALQQLDMLVLDTRYHSERALVRQVWQRYLDNELF